MSKFIGRRIVPKHDGVWDINKEYEELSIVLDKASGESYISRKPVPVGTAISDESYWMQYSLYSAQIAEAVKEMEDTEARLTQYVDTAESNMNSRVNSAESLTNSNKAELNSRMDTLDKRLDANVSASTDKDKDYAAEVVDARVDDEGTKYGSVGSHIRAIGSGKGILKGAVNGSRLSFLDITPELVWTADKYISRKYGGLDNFSQGSNVYFATLDYIPFPYGGCWLQVYSAMSTVESDKSGIAFYDANKKFISGSDYNRETKKLAFRRILCPDGTAYMRMTCMGQDNLDGVGIWLDDYRISVGHLVDRAVTHEKLAEKSVETDNLADEAITSEKLCDNAVQVKNAAFLEIPLEIVLTPDLYIARAKGDLRTYTPGTNTYFATEDYLPFPYGGSKCLLRASMSTASNDVSGLAFYDQDKKYISGLKYNQEKSGILSYTDFICPKDKIMQNVIDKIEWMFAGLGGFLGWFFGGFDGFLYALVVFVVCDYFTGVLAAAIKHELSSEVGFKGIAKKVCIFVLVGIANIIDTQILQNGAAIRTAVVFFYLANEGLSCLENAAVIGLPVPEKLKEMLAQLKEERANKDE